jgi:hypothetical protein
VGTLGGIDLCRMAGSMIIHSPVELTSRLSDFTLVPSPAEKARLVRRELLPNRTRILRNVIGNEHRSLEAGAELLQGRRRRRNDRSEHIRLCSYRRSEASIALLRTCLSFLALPPGGLGSLRS